MCKGLKSENIIPWSFLYNNIYIYFSGWEFRQSCTVSQQNKLQITSHQYQWGHSFSNGSISCIRFCWRRDKHSCWQSATQSLSCELSNSHLLGTYFSRRRSINQLYYWFDIHDNYKYTEYLPLCLSCRSK